ncbi:MAG TPA: hypothetical protein DIW81_04480 [Planctomycetaceae bacterium]|nr:hypothetical protein [Rubinisphaera sp.]HCS50839.1 hypothetical protein [Planctomycetaceae bacterium]
MFDAEDDMNHNEQIERTMKTLERSHSANAMAALVHALQVNIPAIRDAAARTIMRSGSSLGKVEVIKNIQKLSPDVIELLSSHNKEISVPLKHCLLHGDSEVVLRALDTVESALLFEEIPTLLQRLRNATGEIADRCEQVISRLVDALSEKVTQSKNEKQIVYQQSCELAIQQFWADLSSQELSHRPYVVVESILILAHGDNAIARMLLKDSTAEIQSIAWDVLMESRHPGVLLFLTSALNVKYVSPKMLEIISTRQDIEFQLQMIRATPTRPSVHQERNYRQLEGLIWLQPTEEFWGTIPPELHPQLVRLIQLMSFNAPIKKSFAHSIFLYAAVPARKAAEEMKGLIKQEEFDSSILTALDSEDHETEAWGVSQIRDSNLTNKYRLLVNRLDSPHEEVVNQVRDTLGRFDVQRAIEFCESAKPSIGPKLAELLLKINPHAIQELSRELANPVRSRRLRTAQAIHFMQLQKELSPALLELLLDSDSIIRRVVVEILADVPTRQILATLQTLHDDPNPRVREAAEAAIKKIGQTLSEEQASEVDATAKELA